MIRQELTNAIAARIDGEGSNPYWLAALAADEAMKCLKVPEIACPNVSERESMDGLVFIQRVRP